MYEDMKCVKDDTCSVCKMEEKSIAPNEPTVKEMLRELESVVNENRRIASELNEQLFGVENKDYPIPDITCASAQITQITNTACITNSILRNIIERFG